MNPILQTRLRRLSRKKVAHATMDPQLSYDIFKERQLAARAIASRVEWNHEAYPMGHGHRIEIFVTDHDMRIARNAEEIRQMVAQRLAQGFVKS